MEYLRRLCFWAGGLCAAPTSSARDDNKFYPFYKRLDSSIVSRFKPESKPSSKRQDFAMILGVFKAVARAHTWLYVTADTAAESTKRAQKPTPKLES